MREFLVSAVLLGLAASAFASDAASAPEAIPAASAAVHVAAAPAQPKVVCHRETPTGSTIPHNVCHTEAPDDVAQTVQTQQELAIEAQRNRMITVHSGN